MVCASTTPRYQTATSRPVRTPLLPEYGPGDHMRVRTAVNREARGRRLFPGAKAKRPGCRLHSCLAYRRRVLPPDSVWLSHLALVRGLTPSYVRA